MRRALVLTAALAAGCAAFALAQDTPPPAEPAPTEPDAADPGTEETPVDPWSGDPVVDWKRGKKALKGRGGNHGRYRAVHAALDWLARHQEEDGSWSGGTFPKRCEGDACEHPGDGTHVVGLTALATLAFLGSGEPAESGQYRDTVDRALAFLMKGQGVEGDLVRRTNRQWAYDHMLATLAVTEAYALSGHEPFKQAAQRGVAFIHQMQNPYLGWRYGIRNGDNDTSVTCWALHALHVAQLAGLEVDEDTFKGGRAWIDKMLEPELYRVGYQRRGGESSRLENKVETFKPHDSDTLQSMAAWGMFCAGERANWEPEHNTMRMVLSHAYEEGVDLTEYRMRYKGDWIGWYFTGLCAYQLGDTEWRDWGKQLDSQLIPLAGKRKRDCHRGSLWVDGPWTDTGGRIYTTAFAVLCWEGHTLYPRRDE